jgi:membrane-bound metal-dependent hydrolase YbcI (DUF457 family)
MALCFAHAAVGYLAYEAARPAGRHRPALLVAAVALAVGPDLDVLPGLALGRPMVFHRGVSHTVVAAGAVGALVAGVTWALGGLRPLAVGLWALGAWSSHLLLDWLTGDVVPPYGGRFLWPLSADYYIAPVTLLPNVVIDPSGRGAFFASLVAPRVLGAWLTDVGILVAALVGVRMVGPRPEQP